MIAYLLAAALSCDPALTALFTPPRPALGRYEICTTIEPFDRIAADTPGGPRYGPAEMLEPLDAFGTAGPYNRTTLTRLFAGQRVRVARGWVKHGERFESVTLLSPYPNAALTALMAGTMVIRWSVVRP